MQLCPRTSLRPNGPRPCSRSECAGRARATELVIVSSSTSTVDDPVFSAYVERLRQVLAGPKWEANEHVPELRRVIAQNQAPGAVLGASGRRPSET